MELLQKVLGNELAEKHLERANRVLAEEVKKNLQSVSSQLINADHIWGWSAWGSFFAFVYFVLIIFTPLKLGSGVFILGLVVFAVGLAGFVTALFNFKHAPLDQPVTGGLYRISRHPQQLMFFVAFLGICVAIGSWLALFLQLLSSLFLHTRILAEEQACLERYGDSYRDYMKRIPRYFLFF